MNSLEINFRKAFLMAIHVLDRYPDIDKQKIEDWATGIDFPELERAIKELDIAK